LLGIFPPARAASAPKSTSSSRPAPATTAKTAAKSADSRKTTQPSSAIDSVGREVSSLFEKARASLVRVRCEGDNVTLAGTGFFIDEQGTILTAAAIFPQNSYTTVEINGEWIEAKLLGLDRRSGVALLQVVKGLTPFLIPGKSSELKTGLSVVAMGFPRNLPAAPGFGIIGGFDFQYLNRFFPTTHLRINVPVAPGQVGGPVLNSKGEVIGMIVTAIDEGRAAYALPIEAAEKIVADFKKFGVAKHGWVGVGVKETAGAKDPGVQISQLFENTPAAASGLQPGDTVLKIGNRPITCPSDIIDAAYFSRVGEETSVTVRRNGKTLVYKFNVQERPGMVPAVAPDPTQPRIETTPPVIAPAQTTPVPVRVSAPISK
jgi:serine protease Do